MEVMLSGLQIWDQPYVLGDSNTNKDLFLFEISVIFRFGEGVVEKCRFVAEVTSRISPALLKILEGNTRVPDIRLVALV